MRHLLEVARSSDLPQSGARFWSAVRATEPTPAARHPKPWYINYYVIWSEAANAIGWNRDPLPAAKFHVEILLATVRRLHYLDVTQPATADSLFFPTCVTVCNSSVLVYNSAPQLFFLDQRKLVFNLWYVVTTFPIFLKKRKKTFSFTKKISPDSWISKTFCPVSKQHLVDTTDYNL